MILLAGRAIAAFYKIKGSCEGIVWIVVPSPEVLKVRIDTPRGCLPIVFLLYTRPVAVILCIQRKEGAIRIEESIMVIYSSGSAEMKMRVGSTG